jgi:hypothetical protein
MQKDHIGKRYSFPPIDIIPRQECSYAIKGLEAKMHEAVQKFVDDRKRRVFNHKSIHIRNYWEDGERNDINYSLKQTYDGNLDRIKIIGLNGLSDHLLMETIKHLL